MKKRKDIFYGAIGIMTLMLSIMGATFAYFTATASNNATIKGNMATVQFGVQVTKMTNVDVARGGLIPMSNNMVEQALTKNSAVEGKGICVDDNGNAVCQVYKITINNTSTVGIMVDGYVTLANGSGLPTDVTQLTKPSSAQAEADKGRDYVVKTNNTTTMRWAQAFCTNESGGTVTSCTTLGNSTVRSSNTISLESQIEGATTLGGNTTKGNGYNIYEIGILKDNVTYSATDTNAATINGNKYEVIKNNYIRISDHAYDDATYTKVEDTDTSKDGIETSDITSALVFNQFLNANDNNEGNNNGTSSTTFTDSQVFYIVVWLTENGKNQTVDSQGTDGRATKADGFFKGKATFISAQGNEVTATFNGLTKVTPNT